MLNLLTRYSIRTKLFFVIFASAMPIACAFLYFIRAEYEQSYNGAKHNVLVAVQSIALEHAAQVEGIRNLLITLSQFPEVKRMDAEACMGILNTILVQSPSSLNIGVADPEGNVIATGVKQPLPIRYKIDDRKYFKDAIRTGKFSSGEYTVSRAVGKPTLHFALPILDTDGKPQVVIYAALDLTKFVTLFEAQNFPPNAAFSLLDHKGTLLFRYPELSTLKYGSQDAPHLWKYLTNSQDEGVITDIGRDGLERVFGFKRLRIHANEPPYIYIRASVPEKAIISKTHQLVEVFFAISIVALIFSYFLSSILARRLFVLPIEQLSSSVKSVENGDLTVKCGLTHLDDEIGQLAKSFDVMTDSLAEKDQSRKQAESMLQAKNIQLETEIVERKKIELELHENAVQLEEEIAERQKANESLLEKTAELEAEIVEREAAQQSLEEQTTILEEEIEERNRLEEQHIRLEEQLRQSHKMEAIGLLAGGVAHDFNNILSVIMGYGDLLVNNLPKGKLQDNAAQILIASERASELTMGLLAFSRKQKFNLERIDICQLVADNVKFLQRVIGEDIELVTTYPSTPMEMLVDRAQIQQVLMNLATNARDAMASGGKLTINIESQLLDDAKGCDESAYRAVINICDNGSGMPQDMVERIFEPFFTTKEKGKGTGLGLSMVHGIIAQHNGSIQCDSELGKGTTFTIFLPLCDTCEFPVTHASEINRDELRGNETILLAEDDSMLMEITCNHLEANGYRVLKACDGTEAVETFNKHADEIDMVLMDAIMPKITGKQAWDKIHAIRPNVKVCFISGHSTDIISGKSAIDFTVPFISKPVLPTVLLKKIRDTLDSVIV